MTPRPTQPRIGAFFDFDRTVFDGDAGVEFGSELFRIRWRRTLQTRPGSAAWMGRVLSMLGWTLFLALLTLLVKVLYWLKLIKRSRLVRIAYWGLKGWRLEEVEAFSGDFFDEVIAPRLYNDALRAMHAHREQGHVVVVATTNMRTLVEHVKRHAPVDHVIATQLVVEDGRLTGRITGPTYGVEKAAAVRQWAHSNGVKLPVSHGYTDHFSDQAFLALFGTGHVVNASRRLRRLARRKGWMMHEFGQPTA